LPQTPSTPGQGDDSSSPQPGQTSDFPPARPPSPTAGSGGSAATQGGPQDAAAADAGQQEGGGGASPAGALRQAKQAARDLVDPRAQLKEVLNPIQSFSLKNIFSRQIWKLLLRLAPVIIASLPEILLAVGVILLVLFIVIYMYTLVQQGCQTAQATFFFDVCNFLGIDPTKAIDYIGTQ